MNIDLINKFKREFDWFLAGRKLKKRTTKDGDWDPLKEECWNMECIEDVAIVINDEYLDLRIARVDGEKLECWNKFRNEWADLCPHLPVESFEVSECRIKPPSLLSDEDAWLKHNDSGRVVSTKDFDHDADNEEDYSMWAPTKGEYCVFFSNEGSYTVEPFGYKNEVQDRYRSSISQIDWKSIAPLEMVSRLNEKDKTNET